MEEVWSSVNPTNTVRVAVLDGGLNQNNSEFSYCLNTSLSRSFVPGDSSPFSTTSEHGSDVAGLIAARQNNNFGIAGIANNVELVSIKIFESDDTFCDDLSTVADAIDYCSTIGVDIINLSGSYTVNHSGVKEAIEDFEGLFITTAGNIGTNLDVNPRYPACYDLSNIIVVGATDEDDNIMSNNGYDCYSGYGANSVDLFAPGDYVCTIGVDGWGSYGVGTSFAAPMVTGAAALYLGVNPNATVSQVKNAILSNVRSTSSVSSSCVSGGILDIFDIFHDHSYTNYVWSDYRYHNASCSCGDSHLEGHFVAGGSFEDGQRYATCLRCGGLAEMGFVVGERNAESLFELKEDGLYYIKETGYYDEILNLSYEDYIEYTGDNL